MAYEASPADDTSAPNEIEFFGVKLKVKNSRLATLLNSDVHDDVQVVGRRARDAFVSEEETAERAEREVARCLRRGDSRVELRPSVDPASCEPDRDPDV
jgi:hypothetical protein